MIRLKGSLTLCLVLSACANSPDVSLEYFLPQTEVEVTVVRTITCNAVDQLIIADAATVTPRHFSGSKRKTIDTARLNSSLANSDFTVEYYGDGRLKGVNVTTTGQASAVLKSAVELAGPLGVFAPQPFPTQCNFINNFETKKDGSNVRDKAVSLTYRSLVTLTNGSRTEIEVTPKEDPREDELESAIGKVFAVVNKIDKPSSLVISKPGRDDVMLDMRQPAQVSLTISTGGNGVVGSRDVWAGSVEVAQHGTDFQIPIPKAALFGKQDFRLTVSPAGAITKIGYGTETGVAQVLSSGALLADELRDTSAERAAAAKAEADLIAQQQRLVRCKADPANCT